jgi:hypothetical protein
MCLRVAEIGQNAVAPCTWRQIRRARPQPQQRSDDMCR